MTFSCLFLNNLPEFLQKELRRTRELPIFTFGQGLSAFRSRKTAFREKDVPADRKSAMV